jgi:hypothetical protein
MQQCIQYLYKLQAQSKAAQSEAQARAMLFTAYKEL